MEAIGPGAAVKRWRCAGASVRRRRRARWSSALRARPGSVGRVILSESLRPALGDQLVDEFAIAGSVGERAAQRLGCGAASCGWRCWPCSPSGPRPDPSGRRWRQPAIRGRGRWRHAGRALACGWGGGLQARHPGSAVGGRSRPGKGICGKTLARVLRSYAAVWGPRRLAAGCAGSG